VNIIAESQASSMKGRTIRGQSIKVGGNLQLHQKNEEHVATTADRTLLLLSGWRASMGEAGY
jgi:hypothetical protein